MHFKYKAIYYEALMKKISTLFLCHNICYDTFKCLVTIYKDSG